MYRMRPGLIPLSIAAAAAAALAAILVARSRRKSVRAQRLRRAFLDAIDSIASSKGWDATSACILCSGGLDSACVAEVGGRALGLKAAFTVVCSEEATDLPYSERCAAAAGLQHHVIRISLDELLRRHLPAVVRVMGSFDPMTLRNDVAIACALSEAAAAGYRCAATGDAADELLGGYSFTHGLAPAAWAAQRAHMAGVMAFGSARLGAHFGVEVASPYEAAGFRAAALALGKEDCVRRLEDGTTVGKVALRELFPHVTSAQRRKDPIEVGCGTTALSRPGFFDARIPDEQFRSESAFIAAHHGVEVRDKEHLFYYRAFRETFPNGVVPGKPRHGTDPCPKCGYQLSDRTQTFCVTCGHYDPQLRHRHQKQP